MLPSEVVDIPSLETLKIRLDRTLSSDGAVNVPFLCGAVGLDGL